VALPAAIGYNEATILREGRTVSEGNFTLGMYGLQAPNV